MTKTCAQCGAEYEPDKRNAAKQRFCRRDCRQAAYRTRRYQADPEFAERERARQREDYWTMSPRRRAIRAMGKRRYKALLRKSLRAIRSERPKEE